MSLIVVNILYLLISVSTLVFLFGLIIATLLHARRTRTPNSDRLLANAPHITVIVNIVSSYERTLRSLDSIAISSYANYDIVLLDNVSGYKNTSQYRKWKPKSNAGYKLYQRRIRAPLAIAIEQAYKRGKRGEIVLVLNSIDTIGPNVLTQTVHYFNDFPGSKVLRLNDMTAGEEGIVGIVASMDDAFNRLIHRLRLSFKKKNQLVVDAGYCFRHVVFSKKTSQSQLLTGYCLAATRSIEPDPGYGRRLHLRSRAAILLAGLALIGLSSSVAAAIEGSGVESLMVLWLAITGCILSLILIDPSLSRHRKGDFVAFIGLIPLMALFALLLKRSPYE